ncbi:geranylgeranyl diphosphate synthase [Penicillium macrosclerotiorum]|uniref:geranylgeranyl diphosphate synthase n=1 Tax=Penicillium macrosclerotiorum TaxID=303699 RepID=UPI002548B661|nr:geranylgeranyl diphosphate synthase [Penicillium macrosclerotiorum]KAJ5698392.1 geranylgeranyl diphosphate synthase [Penicillium macrosclerotiorum]
MAGNDWVQIALRGPVFLIPGNLARSALSSAKFSIDDIQDSSQLRRGAPVEHHIFGVSQIVNSANSAYFVAQRELESLLSPHAFSIFIDELINLHRGQGIELHWRNLFRYMLRQHNKNNTVKEREVDYIRSTGSFQYYERRFALLI